LLRAAQRRGRRMPFERSLYNVPVFQIILLPQQNYWDWVRACRDFVLSFGAYLAQDPRAAGRYMAPRQVISFPRTSGGFAESDDIEGWLSREYPEVRLDPIEADSPESLAQELARRVAEDDRFGQKQRPFFLLWPTEFPVITQSFGANPRIYTRFGMPGHEGVDIRALPNTKVFACADGQVYRVESNPKVHAYGIHIRIRHRDGYRTIYGHLAKALVKEGEPVTGAQVIGLADATGASVGHHLHLSLKKDQATELGETNYPQDIIDPTGFLVWPEPNWPKGLPNPTWPMGKCLVGAHGRIGAALQENDLQLIDQARLEAVVVSLQDSVQTIEKLRSRQPAMFLLARLSTDFSGEPLTPIQFVASVQRKLRDLYQAELRYFELCPNPNLQSEGWGRSWQDGQAFAAWFAEAAGRLRDRFSDLKLGFPGLSPGARVPGKKADPLEFLDAADEAALAADWLGVNCYWTDLTGMEALSGGRLYQEYRLRYPAKLLMITEFGNPSIDLSPKPRAGQYLEFYRQVRDEAGIGAAFCFTISASEGYPGLAWSAAAESGREISTAIGSRAF